MKETLPAVVLAAGMSRRMGRFKPLLPLGGRPIVAHVVDALGEGGAVPIVVVTGHRPADIEAALVGRNVQFAHNENFATEHMLSSVKVGVRSFSPSPAAFMLVLGDHPAVAPQTVRTLIESWRRTRAPIVVPTLNGHRGHPFVVACIADVLELGAGESMKTLVTRYDRETVRVPVADMGVVEDVDTPEDYERLAGRWGVAGRGGGGDDDNSTRRP